LTDEIISLVDVCDILQYELKLLDARLFKVQINLAKDVLKKVESNLDHHQQYEQNLAKTREWIDHAKQVIRQSSEAASSNSRDELEARLNQVQVRLVYLVARSKFPDPQLSFFSIMST